MNQSIVENVEIERAINNRCNNNYKFVTNKYNGDYFMFLFKLLLGKY